MKQSLAMRLLLGCLFSALLSAAVLRADEGEVWIPTGWYQLSADGKFALAVPPGTTYRRLQGIDSFVGEFVNPNFRIGFDYGPYSNSLQGFVEDPAYVVERITVDGQDAVIVKGPGHDAWDCKDHLIAMYVRRAGLDRNGRLQHLEMDGCTKETKTIETLRVIFGSIHFARYGPNRSRP